jgi:inner membrane protein
MNTTTINQLWTKSKVLIKAFIVLVIFLLLQIPALYVKSLVEEREARQKDAIAEVSSKWASKQTVAGPMIVVPYYERSTSNNEQTFQKHLLTILPGELKITADVQPQEKSRGIYKVMLYHSSIHMAAKFQQPDINKLNIPIESLLWKEAYIKLFVEDVKGLDDEIKVKYQNQQLQLSPFEVGQELSSPVQINSPGELENAEFSTDISLNGSEQLLFTPVGKSTSVEMHSAWPHPSFTGDILPQHSQVSNNGFNAEWKSFSHKRNFPQQWKDNNFKTDEPSAAESANINSAAFGADFFIPVNGYQKTLRSVKYAALCIILTFAAFFLIETNNKKSVHPFHYLLVGVALILFYTLLLSLSEYIGFNASYLIAAAATIALVGWFVSGLLQSLKASSLLSAILVLLYTYIFTILQLQDYSLLLGSVGLFITLAVIMHFSKKMQW